jgi:hypothetical protein
MKSLTWELKEGFFRHYNKDRQKKRGTPIQEFPVYLRWIGYPWQVAPQQSLLPFRRSNGNSEK